MMRRLLLITGDPRLLCGELLEFLLVDHSNPRPHPFVSDAAELVTWHQSLAWLVESCGKDGDVARHEPGIDVRALDHEAVDHVRARRPERDRRVGRHDHAARVERVLLTNGAHRDRAVRFNGTTEIRFDELALHVDDARLDRLDDPLR